LRVEPSEALSDTERGRLAIFTRFLMTRTPRFKAMSDNSVERVAREVFHGMVADPARAEAALKLVEEELGEKVAITPQQLRSDGRCAPRFMRGAARWTGTRTPRHN